MTTRIKKSPDYYLDLEREFPLKPIKSDTQYEGAMRMIRKLAPAEEGTLEPGEQDYLDTLILLIEAHDGDDDTDITLRGLPYLKEAMASRSMTTTDLGKIVGSKTLASLILSGKRQLSRRLITLLAKHFHADPGLFI